MSNRGKKSGREDGVGPDAGPDAGGDAGPDAGGDAGGDADDGAALWDSIARSVKPIRRKNVIPEVATRAPAPPTSPSADHPLPRPRVDLSDVSIGGKAGPARDGGGTRSPDGLSHGDAPGVDRRTAEKFRRGLMPIEATLDLHGHSQESGFRALKSFVHAHQAAGRRCVLVITGKGLKDDWSVGVLRSALPDWLNAPDLRKLILAFSYAQPHHGGSGAVYLLLRRNRHT